MSRTPRRRAAKRRQKPRPSTERPRRSRSSRTAANPETRSAAGRPRVRSRRRAPVRAGPGFPSDQDVVAYIAGHPGGRARSIAAGLGVAEGDTDAFLAHLATLGMQGVVLQVPDGGWDLAARTPYRVGVLDVNRRGVVFLRSSLVEEEDIRLGPDDTRDAIRGDTVLVRTALQPRRGKHRRRSASVVAVLRRTPHLIGGTYWKARKGGVVQPDDERTGSEIYIRPELGKGAIDGQRVLVRVLDGSFGPHPHGEVVEHHSEDGSLEWDLQMVTAEFELPREHAPAAEAEAAALPVADMDEEGKRRVDLRDLLTFTIDPVDARDFDDAVSLEALGRGRVRLGVHIADVSHYVPSGSSLDRCAEERGTSVYLPGRVLPMLPERLANDLCSLRPGEDRLTKTVRITFTAAGTVAKSEVFRSVIRSRRRFSYEEVQAILDDTATAAGEASAGDHMEYAEILARMGRLRDALRRQRQRRGAIYLDLPKVRLVLDASGEVVGTGQDARDASHDLIEEFMLAANESVANFLLEAKLPGVMRVHPPPDEDRLEVFSSLVKVLGLKSRVQPDAKSFQRLIREVEGDPLAPVVQLGLLRTMGHAEYVSEAGLHFALATNAYCHFTSPIRRYPDLLVHQLLDEHFDRRLRRASRRAEWSARLPGLCEWTSWLERRAEEAERAMTQLRLIRYLERFVGREWEGRIVSVHAFGFFVRIEEILVDGLVHVATLGGDYYEFDADLHRLVGERRGRILRLGQRVRVRLADVDPEAREISLDLVDG